MTGVSFLIVNEQDAMSRAMYWELKRRAPPGVPVYQQAPLQKDVWEILDGDKDDFLIYDRCGLLTFHVVLPYSLLNHPYVEAAIRATYFKNICNCTDNSNHTIGRSSFLRNETSPLNQPTHDISAPEEESQPPPRNHHHVHYHQHHHHHVHHHHHPPVSRSPHGHQHGTNQTDPGPQK